MSNRKSKIILGMSGGVDSSVSASLLQEKGFLVEGVFLEFWESDGSNFDDAKKVADLLKIKLHRIDAKKEFKEKIVDHFVSEYESGRTPNPCVLCNPKMKFKVLLEKMNELEGDFVATGHYAMIREGRLFQAKDKRKDQSYFLHGLKKEQIEKIMFPLGELTKNEIREIARERGLPVAEKSESQDVCFVLEKDFSDFLKKHIKKEKGEIIDVYGNVLGEHIGLPFYTIGQRKGINLGGDGPYYVVEKRMDKNQLVVTNDPIDSMLNVLEMKVGEVNWIRENLRFPLKADVKIRYQGNSVRAIIEVVEGSNECMVKFDEPQKAVTPGQSAVFYEGEEVLGGGVIK
jgi:tRNA-specific 2-thiouridylase